MGIEVTAVGSAGQSQALTQVLPQRQAARPDVCTGSARPARGAPSPVPTSLSRLAASLLAARRAATAPWAPSSTACPVSRSEPAQRGAQGPPPSPPLHCLSSLSSAATHPCRTCPLDSAPLPHVTPGECLACKALCSLSCPVGQAVDSWGDTAAGCRWLPERGLVWTPALPQWLSLAPGSRMASSVEPPVTGVWPGAPPAPQASFLPHPMCPAPSRPQPGIVGPDCPLRHPTGEAYPQLDSAWPQIPGLLPWGPDSRRVPAALC